MLIHWRLQQVKDKFLLLVDTRHSSETFKGCILFVKNRSIGLMACFWPSGGKTTEHTCASHHITPGVTLGSNTPRAISINPPFPPWVPPSNLASQLPPTPSCGESIVKSKEDVEPKESIRLDEDVGRDSVTDKDIKEVPSISTSLDNFRMNTGYGRYGAAYNMVGSRCFNEELSLLPKNPTEAKLQATSTRGESTEPT
jgi:hypothetical protein